MMDAKRVNWTTATGGMFDTRYKPAFGARMTEQAICDICDDHKEGYHTTCCNTAYCRHCLDRLFEEATKEVSHPAKCCMNGTPISVESVEALLSEDTTQRYKKAVVEFQVPARERTYCVSCGSFVPVSNTLTHTATCTSCNNSTCTLCKQGSHEGDCPSTTADSEFREVARKNGWQQCPNCGYMIALVEGCDHMTCICGRNFCYVCGEDDCGYRCRRPANYLRDLLLEMRDLSEQFQDEFDVLYGLFENLTNGMTAGHFVDQVGMYPNAGRVTELGRTLERTRTLPSEIRSHLELIHQAPIPAPISSVPNREQVTLQESLQQQQVLQRMRQRQQQQQDEQQLEQQLRHDQTQEQRIFQQMLQHQQQRQEEDGQRLQQLRHDQTQQQMQQQYQELQLQIPQQQHLRQDQQQLRQQLQHDQLPGRGASTGSTTAWEHSPYYPFQPAQNDLVPPAQHRSAWYGRRAAQEHPVFSPQYSAILGSDPTTISPLQTDGSNSVSLDLRGNGSFLYHGAQIMRHNSPSFYSPFARHQSFYQPPQPTPQATSNESAALNTMLLTTASDKTESQATTSQKMGSQGMATQVLAGQSPVLPNLDLDSNLFPQAYEQQAAALTRGDRKFSHSIDRGKRKGDGEKESGGRTRGRGPY